MGFWFPTDGLNQLSFTEEQLIGYFHPVIMFYRRKGHQFGYSGQNINFSQDITGFSARLCKSTDTVTHFILLEHKEVKDINISLFVATNLSLLWNISTSIILHIVTLLLTKEIEKKISPNESFLEDNI